MNSPDEHRSALVLVAGFSGALAAGLGVLLGRDPELRVVAMDGADEIAPQIAAHRPDAALVSFDALADVTAVRELTTHHPATGIVVGVPSLRRERDDLLLAAGARMVVPISLEAAELGMALKLVARRLVALPSPGYGDATDGFGLLTRRELQVLELLVRRRTMAEVAEALAITVATVNTHRHRIYEKLGVHDRTELRASAAALRNGYPRELRPGPLLSRDRLPFRHRLGGSAVRGGGSPLDMRTAIGMRRWRGHG